MSDPIKILPHADSDLPIPRTSDIIARIADLRRDATQQRDTERTRQFDNLTTALTQGIKMAWNLGDLLVSSASTPGVIYTVSCGRCTCPARKPCKHLALAEVLLDLLDAQAGDADLEADCDEPEAPLWTVGRVFSRRLACDPPGDNPLGDDEGDELPSGRSIAQRLCAARQVVWAVNWDS